MRAQETGSTSQKNGLESRLSAGSDGQHGRFAGEDRIRQGGDGRRRRGFGHGRRQNLIADSSVIIYDALFPFA